MLKRQIQLGHVYSAKISGNIVPVRILSVSNYGGWNARNLNTNRDIRIKSAAKLRMELSNYPENWS